MTSTSDDHGHEAADPVPSRVRENSWSANLEHPEYGEDRELLLEQAIEAIEQTAPGYHVNLVTHETHGHPADYLYDELEATFKSDDLEWEHVDQCGCGGHVTRVHVQ